MKLLAFSCLICALNLYVAQKLLQTPKVAEHNRERPTVVKTDGRAYGHVITKISRMDGLQNFLRYGAPLASAKFARGASLLDYLHEPLKKKTKRQRKINYGVFQKSCSPQDACPKWGALFWTTPGKTADDVRCTSNESSQHQKTMHWGARDKRERCTQGNSTNGSKHTTMYRQVTPPFAFEENNAKPWPRESEIKTVSFLTFHHG